MLKNIQNTTDAEDLLSSEDDKILKISSSVTISRFSPFAPRLFEDLLIIKAKTEVIHKRVPLISEVGYSEVTVVNCG